MNTLSSFSAEEVLNYIEMPAAAYKAISELIDKNKELAEEIESLETTVSDIEYVYNQFEAIINRPCFKGNAMLPELIEVSNTLYKII